jgi:outer membrane biosynthesis protein TonB
MVQIGVKKWFRFTAFAVLLTSYSVSPNVASAAASCEPPEAGEYLVLIVSETTAEQDLARKTLPSDIKSEVCRYVEDLVTRVGGFKDQLIAEDWAAYLKESSGLQTYVVKPETVSERPPSRPVVNRSPASELQTEPRSQARPQPQPRPQPQTQPQPRPQPPSEQARFNPRRLGSGYAVLVDYLNQPDLAAEIEEITGTAVGLASYGQRPYLLVTQTNSLETATSTLQTLSNRGFLSLMVDSRRVTLISPNVNP